MLPHKVGLAAAPSPLTIPRIRLHAKKGLGGRLCRGNACLDGSLRPDILETWPLTHCSCLFCFTKSHFAQSCIELIILSKNRGNFSAHFSFVIFFTNAIHCVRQWQKRNKRDSRNMHVNFAFGRPIIILMLFHEERRREMKWKYPHYPQTMLVYLRH